MNCFSFYPTKNLGAIGDGGMVVSMNADLVTRVRRLRQYGWDDSLNTYEAGTNSRLDPLQAAVLGAKLPHLDADNSRRAVLASRYNQALAGLPLTVPAARPQSTHVYHLYVTRSDERDHLREHLAADRIGSAVHYRVPVHCQSGYANKVIVPKNGLPEAAEVADRILSLPIYP